MSLINDMLKDLDNPGRTPPPVGEEATIIRPAATANPEVTLLPSPAPVPARHRNPTRGLWLLLPLVLAGGVAALHVTGHLPLDGLIPPGWLPAPAAPLPAPSAKPAPKPTPTLLTAIEQTETQDRIELALRLSAKPSVSVLPDSEGRHLSVTLSHTADNPKVAPPTSFAPPLAALRRETRGKDLIVHFYFSDPIHFKYSVDSEQNRVLFLVGLKQPAPPPAPPPDVEEPAPQAADLGLASEPPPQLQRQPAQKTAEETFQEGMTALDQGDRGSGLSLLAESLHARPGHLATREKLARALMAGGRLAEANRLLGEGLAIAPNHPPFVILQARLMEARGERKNAIALLHANPPPLDRNPDYHAFLAGLLLQDGQAELAAGLYGEVLAKQPDNSAWWMGLGLALERTGQYDMARSAFRNALTRGSLSAPLKQFVLSRLQKNPGGTAPKPPVFQE